MFASTVMVEGAPCEFSLTKNVFYYRFVPRCHETICETDPRSSVEAGWAVFQRENLFLPITSFQVFNQSVIGAIRSAAIGFLQLFSQRDAFFFGVT